LEFGEVRNLLVERGLEGVWRIGSSPEFAQEGKVDLIEVKRWDLVVAVADVREKVDMREFHIVDHSPVVGVDIDFAVAEEERNFGEEGK
jgi:hypothetical protein